MTRSLAPRLLIALATTTLLLAACTSGPPPVHEPPTPSQPSPTSTGSPAPVVLKQTGPVRAPAKGVLVGAWVKPLGSLTQSSRVEAIAGLQHDIGRKLDIVNTYRTVSQSFPTTSDYDLTRDGATLMVSWATGDTRSITSGAQDAQIVAWAHRFASFGRPILLRMRWEMDRPNLRASMWSGEDFVAAWDRVRKIFKEQHVTNVAWVWCPTAGGFANRSAPAFYPGDSEVDWTCVDVYSASQLQPLSSLLQPFLTWAASHPKPIIIGEFGIADAYDPVDRAAWLEDAVGVFRSDPQIKAVSYFDSDPDGAIAEQSFALPAGSPPMKAFATLAQTPYFNPKKRPLTHR